LLERAYRRAVDLKADAEQAPLPPEVQSSGEHDLIDDFLLPTWRMPSDEKNVRQLP
jgi:hypothetical protein